MKTLIDLYIKFPEIKNKDALIYRTGVRRFKYSYLQLFELSAKMANWLKQKGVKKGDRVAIWAPNSPWWVISFWGVLLRGAIIVPIDYTSGKNRAEQIIKLAKPKLILQSLYKFDKVGGKGSYIIEDLQCDLEELTSSYLIPAIVNSDIAEIVYTSGTTGDPKGVILTHGNLIANIAQVDDLLSGDNSHKNYKVLSVLPLSHMFEQTVGFFIPLYHQMTIVYLRTIKPSAILEALKKEDIYVMVTVPRFLQAIKNSIELEFYNKGVVSLFNLYKKLMKNRALPLKKKLFWFIHHKFGSNFKYFVSGGSALDPVVFKFWQDFGFKIIEGYGLSECSPILTANSVQNQVMGSVGKPLQGVKIKIVDKEILAQGKNVFSGYWGNIAATQQVFDTKGWFKTGDEGVFDDLGNLYIKGRKKDIIVTGSGVNVYPEEIERVLNNMKGVKDACVVGFNQGEGEQVHAVLILDTQIKPEDIIFRANSILDEGQRITGFSLWKEVEFPRTTTLKIQKFKVIEQLKNISRSKEETPTDVLTFLIAKTSGKLVFDITDKKKLASDLGITSIGRLELVNFIEQEFRIDLEDTAINQHTTVGDLRNIITNKGRYMNDTLLRYWSNTSFGRQVREITESLIHFSLFKLFVKQEVKGLENLKDLDMPVIFIANHLSYADQTAIMLALPKKWRYFTATAAWQEFFFPESQSVTNKFIKRLMYEYSVAVNNIFPIAQSSGFRKTLNFMGWLVDNRINILIFPEGERSISGKVLPFRPGLGLIVKELQVPVVPIKIEGMENIFPRGASFPKKGSNVITIGKPLFFSRESPSEIITKSRAALINVGTNGN